MAYGGKSNVTKEVVFYVKNNCYMTNSELDRNIRERYGYTYANSTYDRIRRGEYDGKFSIVNNSSTHQEIYNKQNNIEAQNKIYDNSYSYVNSNLNRNNSESNSKKGN